MSSISMDNMNLLYSQSLQKASTADVEKSLASDMSEATDEELMDACKQFEAYFIEQVYKSMQKMVPDNDDSVDATSQLKDYYEDALLSQYAETTANQGKLGIAEKLYEQMKRNYSL